MNDGTQVLKELVYPWAKSQRVVVADSFFASVQAAQELYKIGLRFIGIVKTATRHFPMSFLSQIEFNKRGEWYGLSHAGTTGSDPDLIAFTWVDRNRRFFISSCSSLRVAAPIVRHRMQQIDRSPNAAPVLQRLEISQPACSKLYYDNCGRIDQHNRVRQDGLKLERKFGTHDWSKRLNLTLLSVCVVDTYKVYKGCTEVEENFNEFVCKLADEMIDYGYTTRFQRSVVNFGFGCTPEPSRKRAESSSLVRLTPQKRPRCFSPFAKENGGSNGKVSGRAQLWCNVCGNYKTSWLCSHCSKEVALCGHKTGRECFKLHCQRHHEGMIFQGCVDG